MITPMRATFRTLLALALGLGALTAAPVLAQDQTDSLDSQAPLLQRVDVDDRGQVWMQIEEKRGFRMVVFDSTGTEVAEGPAPFGVSYWPLIIRGDALYITHRVHPYSARPGYAGIMRQRPAANRIAVRDTVEVLSVGAFRLS